MDRALQLTFNLLLTLLVKLPVVGFFFKSKKRSSAIGIAFIINLITWIISTIIWLKTAETTQNVEASQNTDINHIWIRLAFTVVEAVAYWFFLGKNLKKAILMAVISNILAYFATEYISLPEGFFQKKDNMIR